MAPQTEASADVVPPSVLPPVTLALPAGYFFGQSNDVNDAGVIAGEAFASVGSEPFVWSAAGGFQRLSTTNALPYGSTRAINSEGYMVGQIYNPPSLSKAVFWTPGGTTVNPIPGLDSTTNAWAHDINDREQIAGEGVLESDRSRYVAYRYSRQKGMEVLPTLGGPNASGYAINASGVIVGMSMASDLSWHPTLWSSSNMPTNLGSVAGGYATIPAAINAAGVVVGYSYDVNFMFRPVVWRTPGKPEILRLPQGATSGIVADIDDFGRIYGLTNRAPRIAIVWSRAGEPNILPQAPTTFDATPTRVSKCGKIAAAAAVQWMIWNRVC